MNTADKMAKLATAIESTACVFDEEFSRHIWQLVVMKFIDRSGGILLKEFSPSEDETEIFSFLFGRGGGGD